jgi:hypothetical protein
LDYKSILSFPDIANAGERDRWIANPFYLSPTLKVPGAGSLDCKSILSVPDIANVGERDRWIANPFYLPPALQMPGSGLVFRKFYFSKWLYT